MQLEPYSMGIGDRFAHQGRAQLQAFVQAKKQGLDIVPVWNKSHREHTIIGSRPGDVRRAADAAVAARGWTGPYHVDADHIGLGTVDGFLEACDFFTLDVADCIGRGADAAAVKRFVTRHDRYLGRLEIPGVEGACPVDAAALSRMAARFLPGVQRAGAIYRHIAAAKGAGHFITEVSMDETEEPQNPVELFFILAALADEAIPAQTIAPKFTGRFNKGVDYVGDRARFIKEFRDDLAVIRFAVSEFDLPANLKLSVHSGSDKFSIYPPMHEALVAHGAGVHLKTAGTTWLEELVGLASAGGEGLAMAVDIYRQARVRFDELCGPYATVIDIDPARLPSAETVASWSGDRLARAIRHDPTCSDYNPDIRQLLHVAYKVAAELGRVYLDALDRFEETISEQVTKNLYERHMLPLFAGRRP